METQNKFLNSCKEKIGTTERGISGFGSSDSKKVRIDTVIVNEEAILACNDKIITSNK